MRGCSPLCTRQRLKLEPEVVLPVLAFDDVEDDQIVPYVASGPLSARLPRNGTLRAYKDFPHGMPTAHAPIINTDLLAFIRS
jgi:non-heme chloroperoxidase